MNPNNNNPLIERANQYRRNWIHSACVSSSDAICVPRAFTAAGLGFLASDARYFIDVLDQRIQASTGIKNAIKKAFDDASFRVMVAYKCRNNSTALDNAKAERQDILADMSGWIDWIDRLIAVRKALHEHVEAMTIKLQPIAAKPVETVKPIAVLEVEKVDPDQLKKFGAHGKAKRTTARNEHTLNSREVDYPFHMLKDLIAA